MWMGGTYIHVKIHMQELIYSVLLQYDSYHSYSFIPTDTGSFCNHRKTDLSYQNSIRIQYLPGHREPMSLHHSRQNVRYVISQPDYGEYSSTKQSSPADTDLDSWWLGNKSKTCCIQIYKGLRCGWAAHIIYRYM